MKTGGWGSPWITLDHPKPPPVDDRYRFWLEAPPEPSPRCLYWLRQIARGWRPNRFIQGHDYDSSAEWYGIYIWEYVNAVSPELARHRPLPTS